MSDWIVRGLLILLAAAGLLLYHYNSTVVTVVLWKDSAFQLPLALAIILFYCAGALTVAFFLFLLRIKAGLQTWRFSRRLQMNKTHRQLIAEARSQLALGNLEAARALFSKIITQDPDDIAARVQLAETYRSQGLTRDALDVLEQARVADKKNPELLLFAAQLNEHLGNFTAAHDNAAILLAQLPESRTVLDLAARSAAQLDRFDAAIDYYKRLLRYARSGEDVQIQERIAALEIRAAKKQAGSDPAALRKALEEVLQRHRSYVPALRESAAIEAQSGNPEAAAKLWTRAYAENYDRGCLEDMAAAWLKAENPERAIKAVAGALQNRRIPEGRLREAKIFYVELLLQLEMTEQARRELEELRPVLGADASFDLAWNVLQARINAKEGRYREGFAAALQTIEALEAQETLVQLGTGAGLRRKANPEPVPARGPQPDADLVNEITPPLLSH